MNAARIKDVVKPGTPLSVRVAQTTGAGASVVADAEANGHASTPVRHVYEVRPQAGASGFELISDILPRGRLAFEKQRVATGYARLHSGSHPLRIRIFDARGNLVATHESPSPGAVSV